MPKTKRTKYKIPTPKNMTVKEASEYWDKHSFFDFDDIEEVDFDVHLEGEKHYVLLDSDVAQRIDSLARKKKRPRHVLVNSLLKRSLTEAAP